MSVTLSPEITPQVTNGSADGPTFRRRETTLVAVRNRNMVPEPSIPGAKRPAREGERSLSSAEVNEWH